MTTEPRLRFGILCNGVQLEHWQRNCIEQLHALPGVLATTLLVPRSATRVVSARLFRYLDRPDPGSPRGPVDLPDHVTTWQVVEIEEQGGGAPERVQLAVECAAAVRAQQLHFILSFSDRPLSHALSDLAIYGVWVMQFGDWENFRGDAPGFWEVYHHVNVSGAMLARLTREHDTVTPLRRGYLSTKQFSYQQNRDQLLTRFTHWPAQVCREILQGDAACLQAEPLRGAAAVGAIPRDIDVLRFACRMLWYVATSGVRSLLQYDHWNIGIVRQPIKDFIDPDRERQPVQWLPARRRGEFVADPFGLVTDDQLTIFCEVLDYHDGVGRIGAIKSPELASLVPVAIGPQPAVHLSYPMIIESEGRILCIPETQAAREVVLYALERFPDKWTRLATLIENSSIVDATLFRHGDYWWLAGATDPGEPRFGADLHLWYAAAITGPWTAHPDNPVKTDVRSARPAGTPFVVAGVLYRPAQDSSSTYGSRVVINQVHTLTPVGFCEEPVAFVEPDADGPYPDGLHTLSAAGDITLIDGKRLAFAPAEFRRSVVRMLLRRLQRLAYFWPSGQRGSNSSRHRSA